MKMLVTMAGVEWNWINVYRMIPADEISKSFINTIIILFLYKNNLSNTFLCYHKKEEVAHFHKSVISTLKYKVINGWQQEPIIPVYN